MASSWENNKKTGMLLGRNMSLSAQRVRTVTGVRVAMAAVLFASITACSESGFSDLNEYVANVKARPAARIPPLPEFKTYETFSYSAGALRDPFVLLQDEAELVQATAPDAAGPKPDENRNRETLEGYPLDTLRFVGQLEKDDEKWAIVTSPDSLVHRVKVGNYLGQNYGKITAVTESQLEITELVSDGMGGWIERKAALSLGE
ncbi:MAG TPA: pilus assembly protein PilP [Gammaproteobacteria bacterium]|jgi:type IV pilus assembly protein PilP